MLNRRNGSADSKKGNTTKGCAGNNLKIKIVRFLAAIYLEMKTKTMILFLKKKKFRERIEQIYCLFQNNIAYTRKNAYDVFAVKGYLYFVFCTGKTS